MIHFYYFIINFFNNNNYKYNNSHRKSWKLYFEFKI